MKQAGVGTARPAAPTGVFRKIPENRRIREIQFMLPEYVVRTGGSKCVQAQPAGSKWNQALPGRALRGFSDRP